MTRDRSGIFLVNMPFAAIDYPSIQVGLLQSIAKTQGLDTTAIYANIKFFKLIPKRIYNLIAEHRGIQLGDWLFTKSAFPSFQKSDLFMDKFSGPLQELANDAECSVDDLLNIRDDTAIQFVDQLADEILSSKPRVVGFTSTFEQNVASLALARRLKEQDSSLFILFGGANFDGVMGPELVRAFSWIDVAVIGEADQLFPQILTSVLNDSPLPQHPSVVTREKIANHCSIDRATYSGEMDALPTPDYDDYFVTIESLGINKEDLIRPISLPFESARGCWWGEKHHCTFCGLNGLGITYRSKSKNNVIRDMADLSDRYKVFRFTAVDNIISMRLLRELTQELSDGEYDYDLFYEVKANLSRDDIRRMANAGISIIQPGIESLSTNILKLMKKGITALQNVATLKWCRYYGVRAMWNHLYGFPGETPNDYAQQLSYIRQLHYLAPPVGGGRIWLERFSPYFSGQAEGFSNIRPEKSVAYVYPEFVAHDKVAYFFEGDARETINDEQYAAVQSEIDIWRNKWKDWKIAPYLIYFKTHSGIRILDGRASSEHPTEIFYRNPAGDIYIFCGEKTRSISSIRNWLMEARGLSVTESSLLNVVQRMVERRLMLQEGSLYFSLALPAYSKS